MNDSQIISIAIMVLAVLAGSVFNNVRIGDMSKRIDDMRDLLRAEMSKNQSEMLNRFGDLDARLMKMEQRRP
jgi:hypothetical protein